MCPLCVFLLFRHGSEVGVFAIATFRRVLSVSYHCKGSRGWFFLGVCVILMWLPVVFFGSPIIWKGLTCSILMLFSFEGNSALVLPFLMLEFWSVSWYGCGFVWVFCIRLAVFSFCVAYLFFLAVKIWPKKNHEFFGQI